MMVFGGLSALGLASAICAGFSAPPMIAVEDIVQGTGSVVQAGQVITVNFEVYTQEGKEAANTVKRGLPYSFVLGDPKMPPMWLEGIKGMKVGGERRFTAPPTTAYGVDGLLPIVPAGATLTVHVWVLKVRR